MLLRRGSGRGLRRGLDSSRDQRGERIGEHFGVAILFLYLVGFGFGFGFGERLLIDAGQASADYSAADIQQAGRGRSMHEG